LFGVCGDKSLGLLLHLTISLNIMNIREQFKQIGKLCHFTRFDTALKIIESNCLRFGRLNNMNDIHENDKITFVNLDNQRIDEFSSDVLDALQDEIYKYRQISLTAEGEDGDKDGFDLHQMWGLYADSGDGVCLVFDKNELLKNPDMPVIKHGRVIYEGSKKLESFVITDSQSPGKVVDETRRRLHEIFFYKREEWEHEQEYRLLKRCPLGTREEYLWLGHALKFVILSSKLKSVDVVRFAKRITEVKAKLDKVEKVRNNGDDGKIPILIYGNGLFDYSLITDDGNETIWTSSDRYDVPIIGDNCELDIP